MRSVLVPHLGNAPAGAHASKAGEAKIKGVDDPLGSTAGEASGNLTRSLAADADQRPLRSTGSTAIAAGAAGPRGCRRSASSEASPRSSAARAAVISDTPPRRAASRPCWKPSTIGTRTAGEQRLGGKVLYRLGYPNREVRQSLNEHLLRHLVQDVEGQMANSIRLARLLEANDRAGLKELFQAFFASLPASDQRPPAP